MTQGTFAALHKKCMYGEGCVGPGCRVERNHRPTNAPRTRTRQTKPERRLEQRINAWQSPQNKPQHNLKMHKPGSEH